MAETQTELYDKVDKMFRYAVEHPSLIESRKGMIKCFEYREGQQYTPAEISEMEDRGQPVIVNNQVAVTINKLCGDLVANGFRIAYKPRNGPMDDELAELLSDINLYIRQSNQMQFEEQDLAEDGFTAGFGVMEVYVEFDDLNQPEIKVRHEDCLVVYPDPDSRKYDWNQDAKFIARARWLDADEVDTQYPGKHVKDLTTGTGTSSIDNMVDTFIGANYIDQKRERLRVVDIEWKEIEKQVLVLIDDPSAQLPPSVLKDAPGAKEILKAAKEMGVTTREISRSQKTIHRAVFVCGIILEHVVTDQKYYSLVPYYAFRRKDGGAYSLVFLGLSMQDAINKRESKAIHLLTTNQTVAERSAIPDVDLYQENIHRPDGVAIVADGALANQRVLLRNNVELAQQQFNMHLAAQRDFASIVGVDPRAPLDTGELRGNAALKQKFTEIGKPVAKIFENLRRTRTILSQVILDRVQAYYTGEKTLLITDNEGKVKKTLEITKDKLAKIKAAQYDAVQVDEVDTPNVQQEQFGLFLQYLPQILPFGPFWTKKLIEMSDLRNKQQIIGELDQMSGPPPVTPRLAIQANLDGLEPVERAAVWELAGKHDVAVAIQQSQPTPTSTQKSTVDLAKAKIQAETAKHAANVNATNTPSLIKPDKEPEDD